MPEYVPLAYIFPRIPISFFLGPLWIAKGLKLPRISIFIWDDFNFPIVNFPFLSSNIPSAPAYGVYVSQLIRYARTCSNYQDFMERGKVLTQKLLSQGYQKTKLVATLKKFYGRHHDLVNPYNVAVSRIVSDVFASDAP